MSESASTHKPLFFVLSQRIVKATSRAGQPVMTKLGSADSVSRDEETKKLNLSGPFSSRKAAEKIVAEMVANGVVSALISESPFIRELLVKIGNGQAEQLLLTLDILIRSEVSRG